MNDVAGRLIEVRGACGGAVRMAEQSSCKAGTGYGDRLNEPSPVYINRITCSETHYSSSFFVYL